MDPRDKAWLIKLLDKYADQRDREIRAEMDAGSRPFGSRSRVAAAERAERWSIKAAETLEKLRNFLDPL